MGPSVDVTVLREASAPVACLALFGTLALFGSLALLAAGPAAAAQTATPTLDAQTATPSPNGTIDHEGDVVTLEAAPGQPITGSTTLGSGERLSIRLRSTSESPFLRTVETTTGPNGEFEGRVDLQGVEPGATFEVTLLHDGTELTTVPGTVRPCTSDCEPTATGTVADDSETDQTRTVTDDWPSDDEWLAENVVLTHQGQTATIPINVDDDTMTPDSATVTVGSPDDNYHVTATVRDTSGDGRVALLFNTANAGFDAPTLAVEGDDELTVREETSLDSPLAPASYDISVYRYDSTDEEVDIGTLALQERLNGTVTPEEPGTTTATRAGTASPGAVPTTVGSGSASGNSTAQTTNLLGIGALAVGGILAIVGVAVMLGFVRS